LSLSPFKLVDRFGKWLTPTLLTPIAVIFVKSLLTPLGPLAEPVGAYASNPVIKDFLDGYLTMDALAALVFGIVIANTLRSKGISDRKALSGYMIKAGLGAGILLGGLDHACLAGWSGRDSAGFREKSFGRL